MRRAFKSGAGLLWLQLRKKWWAREDLHLQGSQTLDLWGLLYELGNHLIASVRGVPGYDTAEFFPVSETSLNVNPITSDDDIRLTFVPNKKGQTTRVAVYWNGRQLRGARISNQPAR